MARHTHPDGDKAPSSTDLVETTTAQLSRAEELDALDASLPFDRRDQLAQLLTDEDVATLKHLARSGLGDNSTRALASDLAYLEAWAQASTGKHLPWPVPEALLIKFVAHELWGTHQRLVDPAPVILINTHAVARIDRRVQCRITADSAEIIHPRSTAQAASYCNDAERRLRRAARLMI